MYRFVESAGDYLEICDECGFHSGLVDASDAAARFRGLPDSWQAVFSHDDELLRARPEPEVWCAVEYARHTANAIEIIEWAARQVAMGESPDWERMPTVFHPEFHECEQFGHDATLDALATAAQSMAALTDSLTAQELDETAEYGGGVILNTRAVIRHALHDAEHHLLDIRRGIARLQLAT